ncbi:myomegalin isoform X3 [Anolis carolinensis]|uniref:myomegalin isoform X3 n=1 Tax=Anolis carolinensis TaxID=28377 RepID=UPI0007DB854B|nr:PREDICTED: myomegalin isoform X3 [Anolis carolinensis]|eukprot:XP_016848513.1 PREDICTED: myomegalin isoform X3 [Anolis carolinensis]
MQAAKRSEVGAPGGPSAPPGEGKPTRRIGRGPPGRRLPARSGPRGKIAPPASLPSPGPTSRRKETEGKMVPRSGHTMTALVDSIQQSHQMQPQILNYLNPGSLLQTPAAEVMDVACSISQVQPDLVRSLETAVVEKLLPVGYEQSSTTQTQTLRDFEKHLNDLKKENFSLKLRIYFLEERIQQKYEAGKEDIYSRNIELKVEVESLKRELQEKQENLDKAWSAVENSHSQNEAELCQQRKNKHVCETLEKKTHLLQEEVQSANTKAEKMTTLAETEKKRCLELSKQLIELSKKQNETQKSQEMYRVKLAEKDKRIEELTQNLRDKEQLLELLSTEKQHWQQCLEEPQQMKEQNLYDDQLKLAQSDILLGEQPSELNNSEVLEKINCLNATNKQLQEKLDEMTFELRSVQHASQTQGHKIQHLNETLKSKENECQQLNDIIGEQNETITKLQDMLHRSQLGQLQIPEGSSTLQQQQIGLLTVQNTLFSTQLEVQRLKRTQQRKDRQLLEAKKTTQLLEIMLQEEQQQKEEAWKHNKELCATVQQLKTELQTKNWQYCTWERNTSLEMERQEQKIKHLNHKLNFKEQLIQESKELLLYLQKRDNNSSSSDKMVQRLQQRIKDRDAALERAVDEKFCILEDREQELHQLRLSVKEQEQDLERLHQVLSGNKVTIQDLENMLKAKDLELEHLLATYQNLQWLKDEIEAKSCRWQSEQGGIIQQLQTALHDRNKEVEVLSATLLCKLVPGQRDTVEELYFRLHKKEKIIEELLHDKSLQTIEQVTELQELLQAVSSREQQSHISSKKMIQALIERNCELQTLHQQLMSQTFPPKMNASCIQLIQKEVSDEALKQGSSSNTIVSEKENDGPKIGQGVLETTLGLQKELINAKEKLELLTQKERESRMELSALQSVVDSQEKELQVQASDVESLTRSIQIKEEFIKDLQMQLVDPEEMPAIERLTQEVLMLQEKITSVELQGQEDPGNKKLQLLLALEGLVSERSQLNETLKTEKQLYSSLVKLRAHSVSSGPEHILQVELEEVQALRRQLEEALGRSLERLSRLESVHGIGDLTVSDDAEDAGTEFTDSIEEEATQRIAQHQSNKGDADDNLVGCYSTCPSPPSLVSEKGLPEELLTAKSEIQNVLEQKNKLEAELQDLKGQIEEAGFSSVSQLRKALLSLCLENAELKEQVGEAMLSEGWENEDAKEDEENLRLEVRKLQEKLHMSEIVIGLLKEQLTLNTQEMSTNPSFTGSVAQDVVQLQMSKQCNCLGLPCGNVSQSHCPPAKISQPQSPFLSLKGAQVEGISSGQQLIDPLHSESPQCRQECYKLRDKLLVSEATIQAQQTQLEEYRVLLREPVVKQDSKQIQVDLQDLGYETCGRSENEVDREEITSPECEDHIDELKTWKKLLGSHASKLEKHDLSQCEDVAILRQHIQALQGQLQSSHRVIRNLQSRVHSVSTTSDYASGGEHPLKMKETYALASSPSHSITDEDEGWQSDSFGSFCPPSLQLNKDLARLIQRVSHLEAHLGETKPKLPLSEELKPSATLGKYDSLVQAQARELSHLRQAMREGQGLCCMLSQHFRNTIKSFEDLLQGTDIDYFLAQSFREQLTQGNQLTGRLTRKLSSRNDLNTEDKSSHEVLALRLSKELEEKEQLIKTLQAKLHVHSVSPSSNHSMSESSRSGSSTSFLSDGLEGCSDMEDTTEYSSYQEDAGGDQFHSLSADKDLGCQLAKTSLQPSHSSTAPAESPQRNFSLPPSQRALMTVNQASRGFHPEPLPKPPSFPLFPFEPEPSSFMPLGPPPPPAPALLLGCCRTPVFSLAEAQQELQMLQKQLGESSPALPSKDCLTGCPHSPQSFPMQNCPEWGRKSGGCIAGSSPLWYMPPFRQTQDKPVSGTPPSCLSAAFSGQKLSGATLLEEHLSEIRILRQRLEESICTNDHLREQLETRLASMAKPSELECLQAALLASHSKMQDGKAVLEQQQIDQQKLQEEIRGKQQDLMQLQEKFVASQMNNSRLQDRVTILQQQCDENQLLLQALQTELHLYESTCPVPQQATTESHGQEDLVPIDGVNKQEIHVIGHFKDFCTLQKQILEGKNLIHRMGLLLQPGLESQSNKVFYIEVIKQLLTSASCLHQIMEKSATILSMFWKAPLHVPRISSQDQSMKIEIQLLRTKLAEQKSHLQSTRDVKESMENFLLTHLTRTYDVLRKARTNLEGISQQPTPISATM